MNNDRRKTLTSALEELKSAQGELTKINWEQIQSWLDSAKEIVEGVKNEEQEAFENLSENLQQGERGQRMEEVVSLLDDAISDIDECIGRVAATGEDAAKIEEIAENIESTLE